MMVSLDNLAHRYGMLPSEALARATTLDLHILDVGSKYVNYQQQRAEQEKTGIINPPKRPQLTQEQMMDMIKQVRSEK